MATRCKGVRLLALLGSFGLILAGFFAFVRPWYRTWGATEIDANWPLPGDDLVPSWAQQETRAITIEAPVDRVWPWLAQIGQDRGGFYTFDLLENLVGCDMPAGDRLLPEKQSWQIGDRLWMYPPEKAGGQGYATLRTYVPGRALCFATHGPGSPPGVEDGSWSFILLPLEDFSTRFVIRGRGPAGWSPGWTTFNTAIFEPMHFVMERGMMRGLKQRAEGSVWPRLENHVQVLLWTLVFGLFVTATMLVFRRADWGRPLAGFVLSAILFQILTLGQPPLVVGIGLVVALVIIPWWPAGKPAGVERTP